MDMKQQTAEHLKQASHAMVGAVGTGATWGLSDVATGVSIFVGLCTGAYMVSMIWLNIKKGRRLDKSGNTKPPQPL